MVEVGYLSIAEFAEKAKVSKQAIYKQVNNENSQLAPYILREGKRTLIKVSALWELYKVDTEQATQVNPTGAESQPISTPIEETEVDEPTQGNNPTNPKDQPLQPNSTPESQPISTQDSNPISADYIEFLKAQLAEVKADRAEAEQRLMATIQEKDAIIKEQSAQLAQLAKQVAQIADKALIATSQQQYLTAMEKTEKQAEPIQAEEATPAEPVEESKPKKSFFQRLFGR